MTFYRDLNELINAYEAAERLAEIEDEMTHGYSDYAINGEAATVIPSDLVLNADEPVWFIDDAGRFMCLPGVNGETTSLV